MPPLCSYGAHEAKVNVYIVKLIHIICLVCELNKNKCSHDDSLLLAQNVNMDTSF